MELSRAERSRIAAHAGKRARAVGDEMTWLKVPVSLSGGIFSERRGLLERRAARAGLPFVFSRGPAARPAGPPAPLAPGDPLAAAISYGDITFAGIGTATYVCGGRAVAWGHPFLFDGPTLLGASRARVLAIVDDPTFGPYKLASVTNPVGIVDRDRLSALRAVLGAPIPTFPVTQDTTAPDTGRERLGALTEVVRRRGGDGFFGGVAFIAYIHAFANIDSTFDQVGAGGAALSFTVRGRRTESPKRWALARSNRFVSRYDIAIDSTEELFRTLRALERQRHEEIEITGVDIDAEVERTRRELRIAKVLWSAGGERFRDVRRLRAEPGQRIRARVRMRASDTGEAADAELSVRVPRTARRTGEIEISGGAGGREERQGKAKSFNELLDRLASAPRNDDLVAEAGFGRRAQSRQTLRQPEVVTGSDRLIVLIGGRSHPRPVLIFD